jgi:hypothetical protein
MFSGSDFKDALLSVLFIAFLLGAVFASLIWWIL